MWLCRGRDARSTWILTNIQQVVNSDVFVVHNFHHNIYSSYLLLITIIYNNNTHTDNSRSLRSHVHPVERSPVERLLAADLRAPPTSNFLHKKLSQLQQVNFFSLSDVDKICCQNKSAFKGRGGKKWWRSSFSAFASNNPQVWSRHPSAHIVCLMSKYFRKASNRKL